MPLEHQPTEEKSERSAKQEHKRKTAASRREILAPVRITLVVASAIVAAASIVAVLPFVVIVDICRELLVEPLDTNRIWWLLAGTVGLLVLQALLLVGAYGWSHLTDARHQLTVRRALAAKLGRVPLGWFGHHSASEVKQYLRDDVDALHFLVAHAQLDFVGAVVVPLVTLGYLAYVDWRLTLVLLLPLVVYGLIMKRAMSGAHHDRMARYLQSERRVQGATLEFVDGIQVVRAFGQAGKAHDIFQEALDEQNRTLTAWKRPVTRLQAVSEVVVGPGFVVTVVMLAGLAAVSAGWLPALELVPFLLVGPGLGSSLLGLGYGSQALRAARLAVVRLHELQQTPELAAPSEATAVESAATSERTDPAADRQGRVCFQAVTFGYHADRPVLHDLTATLEPGTITALVGPSGSGKSTLAALLPRFHDVTSGSITIDGRDIRDIPTGELYRTVGFVFQDVRLIRGSIRDNLVLARPQAGFEEIQRAARAAQIHDRIVALPGGYDSVIGRDVTLSGGEAQRLSIARALLADTPVLVLDEATACVDPESEAAVQDALAALVARRTVLVIAHRLPTITGVDRILVLDDGRLVEQGTHESLCEAGGNYQRLWQIDQAALELVARGREQIR